MTPNKNEKASRMVNPSGVYVIQNNANGKRYIGSAVKTTDRICRHRWELRKGIHHSEKLQRAWDKYGEGAFEFRVLLVCSPTDLLFYEQLLLDGYKSAVDGYNVLATAGNCLGAKRSAESRQRMSEAQRGMKRSPEFCEMRRAIQTGKRRTEETKAKIRASITGMKRSRESVEKRLAHGVSDETKAKIAAALKGHPVSDETRAKISAAHLARRLAKQAAQVPA